MNRAVSILLCLFGAVACALLAYVGYQQQQQDQNAVVELRTVSCNEMLKSIPPDLSRFQLSEFKPGKRFVSYDDDEDGQWEKVVLPLFPATTEKLKQNYRAIIVTFVDVVNKEALFARLEQDSFEAEYWFTSQTLDPRDYNRLAEKYSSMDFNRSILIHSGYPVSETSFGTYLFWAASSGMVLTLLGFGWQTMSLVIAGIRSESADDDEDEVITNRAGLPTKDGQDPLAPADTDSPQ